MYSQSDEEKTIVEYFQPRVGTGRFLDVGAFDGKAFSNTLRLAELGWRGVAMEPNPLQFSALERHLKPFPSVEVMQMALHRTTGIETFWQTGDAVGTLDKAHMEKWSEVITDYKQIQVPTISWADLLAAVGNDFHFLSLDVEGNNVELFELLPFASFPNLWLLCIEFDGEPLRILARAKSFGYELRHQTAENLILEKV